MVLSLLSGPFRIHELIQFIAPVDRRRYFNRTKNTLRRLLHILFIDTNLPGRKFQHPGGLTHQEGLVADTERRGLDLDFSHAETFEIVGDFTHIHFPFGRR